MVLIVRRFRSTFARLMSHLARTRPRSRGRTSQLAAIGTVGIVAIGALGHAHGSRFAPSLLATPAGPDSETPGLSRTPDGRVWLSWVERQPRAGHVLRVATLVADRWSDARTLASGDSFLVNGADPAGAQPLASGDVAAQWRWLQPGEGEASDVRATIVPASPEARSAADRSVTITPHADRSPVEHGFASLAPIPGGAMIVWLDGRAFAAAGGHEHASDPDPSGDAGMQLRAETLASHGERGREQLIDSRVCECCGTALAVTARGLLVAYRDRGSDERRDISLARYENGRWSEPYSLHRDGWIVHGCPVNGPALDAAGSVVAAAWFTGARDSSRVRVSFSTDGGVRFGRPIEAGGAESLGRTGVTLLADGSAVVSWLERRGHETVLACRRVFRDGRRGPIRTLATLAASRGAGVPRVMRDGDRLVFAWTVPSAVRRVRTATVPVAAFD